MFLVTCSRTGLVRRIKRTCLGTLLALGAATSSIGLFALTACNDTAAAGAASASLVSTASGAADTADVPTSADASPAPSVSAAVSASSPSASPEVSAAASPAEITAAWEVITKACPTGVFVSQILPSSYYEFLRFYPDGALVVAQVAYRRPNEPAPAEQVAKGAKFAHEHQYTMRDGLIVYPLVRRSTFDLGLDLRKPPFRLTIHDTRSDTRTTRLYACIRMNDGG